MVDTVVEVDPLVGGACNLNSTTEWWWTTGGGGGGGGGGASPKCGWAESRDRDIGPGFLPLAFCLRDVE